jgi:hypothetical protein
MLKPPAASPRTTAALTARAAVATRPLAALLAVFAGSAAFCEPKPADGVDPATPVSTEPFWLLNPKPSRPIRDMSTDRPDTTESPYTLDSGHFQLEMSFIDYTVDDHNDEARTRALSFSPLLIKVGLLNTLDLQLGIDPYSRVIETDKEGSDRTAFEGFGDTVLRAKLNLWGNDSGSTASAVMPFITFPTGGDGLGSDVIEGGIILPLGIDLGDALALGLMAEFDAIHDDEDDRYTIDWVHTVTLGFPIAGDLAGYIEYAGFANLNDAEEYRGYADTGLSYALTPNTQLDAGVRVGLTKASEDLGLFVGLSWRY